MLVALPMHSFFYVALLGPSLALMFYLFKRHPSQAPEPAEIARRQGEHLDYARLPGRALSAELHGLGAAVAGAAVVALFWSRVIGLPGYPDGVHQWFDFAAWMALAFEIPFLAVAGLALRGKAPVAGFAYPNPPVHPATPVPNGLRGASQYVYPRSPRQTLTETLHGLYQYPGGP